MPFVQTKIAKYLTEDLNKAYGTHIYIDEISVTIFGAVKIKKILINDHHKDTLIYADAINTNILDIKKLIDGDLIFGTIRLEGFYLNMITYKNEKDTNLDIFLSAFDSGKASTKKFLLKAETINLIKSRFILTDYNRQIPKDVDFSRLNAVVNNFKIYGPDVTTAIEKMSFLDHRGLFVRNLTSDFTYTKKHILLQNLDLITNNSLFIGDIALNYVREDFQDFNNKVQFDINIVQASLATNDIRFFYDEIGKDQYFNLNADIRGTLNDLVLRNLKISDNKNSEIIGNVNFKNLFGKNDQHFYMKGNFSKVASSYEKLVNLLPEVLGKKLPTSLKKIGKFNLNGKTEISTTSIDADFYMTTSIGNIKSNLIITNINNIDNAIYKGNIILENFNIGSFLNKKDLGKVSLNIDVDGKGFKQKYLNTSFSGDIYKLQYNGYNYTKIIVDGKFKNPIFNGKIFINDPNLFLDFDGIVNMEKKAIDYNFDVKVDYANLVNLNFNKTDSISVFKGGIRMNVAGSNFDDLKGDIYVSDLSYQNNKKTYLFDSFTVTSSFESDNLRTITIDSPDIIEGKVVGKFKVNELRKMLENALGSLYTNYKPNKISKNQFLKFNFSINHQIVDIINPNIELGEKTDLRGNINANNGEFKLQLNSNEIKVYSNNLYNINLKIDNRNPLYNTYLQLDSINTKQYKIKDFSLINVTAKDTLFLRSEFKGGLVGQDYYNINLFHTIDKQGNNVVGIKKSELKFKDYLWYLNENENNQNKIVFDKALKNFAIDDIVMSHENQRLELKGDLKNLKNKDLELSFENVQLNKILPTVDKFNLEGRLNGSVNLRQKDDIYQPTASIKIDSLNINKIALGKLNLDIKGDETLKKYDVNMIIENENVESFSSTGNISIADNSTNLDLDLNFDNFNMGILSELGGDVITNIRGFATGKANIGGNVNNIEVNGRLFMDKSGLGIPYLNTNYDIQDHSIVDITEKKFIIRNAILKDVKYKSEGSLNGFIEHKNFSNWKLDLAVKSDSLLILDTQDSEDAAYFGTAFIDGTATIKGPTEELFIRVAAKSKKGTNIKIPINNAESVGENSYIHFITATEKLNMKNGITQNNQSIKGLELEFEFDITPDAEIEIILDRKSGHGMKGKGYGTLSFQINTLGKFNMWGDFQAYEGEYNFRYGGVINKKFDIKKGSSIVWEGDPMRALLNIDAIYKTKANPAVLLENSTVNKKVEVDVVIGLKGNLSNPEPSFIINFPTVTNITKAELETALEDDDERQKQALILLATGGFMNVNGANESFVTNNVYEKFGDVFGSVFNTEGDKIDVSLDLVPQDTRPDSQADGSVGVTFSTKINERISINGKVGVPVGGINDAAVVGDLEILYRVNEDGTLNLKVFNKENDTNYVGEGIGYTQGVGISYEVDFDTFKEMLYKIFKNQKIEKVDKAQDHQDSDLTPSYINFNNESDKKEVPVNVNNEAIPTED